MRQVNDFTELLTADTNITAGPDKEGIATQILPKFTHTQIVEISLHDPIKRGLRQAHPGDPGLSVSFFISLHDPIKRGLRLHDVIHDRADIVTVISLHDPIKRGLRPKFPGFTPIKKLIKNITAGPDKEGIATQNSRLGTALFKNISLHDPIKRGLRQIGFNGGKEAQLAISLHDPIKRGLRPNLDQYRVCRRQRHITAGPNKEGIATLGSSFCPPFDLSLYITAGPDKEGIATIQVATNMPKTPNTYHCMTR